MAIGGAGFAVLGHRTLLQIALRHFDFGHVVVVKKIVLAVIPGDPHAGPIASRDRAPIRLAIVPGDALADLELLGLIASH